MITQHKIDFRRLFYSFLFILLYMAFYGIHPNAYTVLTYYAYI